MESAGVGEVLEYFLCDECECKDFQLMYNFGLRFRTVNFSDELVYDELIQQEYQCSRCGKVFSKSQIEKGFNEIKKKHRGR